MIIRSNYRDSAKEQFEMLVVGETETEYLVQILPKWQSEFQEGDSIHPLRKCLVGDSDNLYSIKEEKTIEQLSLF